METWPTFLIVLIPALAALVTAGLPARFAGPAATLGSALALAMALQPALSDEPALQTLGSWVPGLGLELSLRADALTLALALLVSGVGTVVLHYAGAYFGATGRGRKALAWLLVFEASMLGLVLADNALLLFVFWELTGVCSFFLIQLDADKSPEAEPAARQALLVTVLGGLPLLVGLLFLQQVTGTSSITAWSSTVLDPKTANLALLLVGLGALAKSAQFPFHFWLPGAMAAPSPISAYLHSATMVKAGIILFLLLFPVLHTAPLWTPLLLGLGAVTSIWGSYRALTESDIKKLMAWSTVSQLGLLTLTLGLGTESAARAAILHLFAHGIFKAGLFLIVGSIDKTTGTRELGALGGLAKREPVLAFSAFVCAGSMAGLPPLAGFLSKELILKKTMLADPALHLPALFAIVVASIGTMAYSIRFFAGVFLGADKSSTSGASGEQRRPRLGWTLWVGPAALALLTLVAGVNAPWVDRVFLEPASAALLGHDLDPPKLKLWYGWNLPLFLSLGILAAGAGLQRILRGRYLPIPNLRLAPHRVYHGTMAAAANLGSLFDRALTGGDPRIYVVLPLVVGFIPAWLLLSGVTEWNPNPDALALSVVVGLGLAALGLVRSRGQIAKIVWSSVLGFGVAILFRRAHAPDLVLTQILVEMIVTVVFLLGIRRLKSDRSRPVLSSDRRAGKGTGYSGWLTQLAALVVAVGAASLVLAFAGRGGRSALPDFYAWAGPELAKGHNLVNVILVDFRGLDTFIEAWVVLLAGLGVVALFRGGELGSIPVPEGTLRSSGPLLRFASGFLVPLTVLLALSLFLQGHDDPGGGFAASLVLVLGWLLFALARGGKALVNHGARARKLALGGAAVLLLSACLPLILGEPALRHAGTVLGAGTPLAWKTHSSLLFDLGVVMAVAGIGTAALLPLLVGGRR